MVSGITKGRNVGPGRDQADVIRMNTSLVGGGGSGTVDIYRLKSVGIIINRYVQRQIQQ